MPPRKCDKLSEILRNQIVTRQLMPGTRLISENELCVAHSMSRQVVRQAIGILRKEGLVQTVQGSGTYVVGDSRIAQRATSDISVILPYDDDYIFGSFISGIQSTLAKHDYIMQMYITHNSLYDEEAALASVLNNPPAGIIIDPAKSLSPRLHGELYQQIKDKRIPCINMNCSLPGFDFPLVAMDDVVAGELATNYLASQGHKSIGFLCNVDSAPGQLRINGYLREMSRQGFSDEVTHTVYYTTVDEIELFRGAFDQLILKRFAGCTAIICFNDRVAVKLVNLLNRHGLRVPEDISIVGHDGSLMSEYVTPKLTTIQHLKSDLGVIAAENLARLIADPEYDAGSVIAPKLIVRDSVKLLNREAASSIS